jgi:nicotinamidase-related amidase
MKSYASLAFSHPLNLRSRVETFKGSGQWEAVTLTRHFDPSKTALLVCDMWDRHWCRGAEERAGVLARRIGPVIELARERGVLIIHAPSDTIEHYHQTAARINMLKIAACDPPEPLPLADPPLPIDDSDGGCEGGSNTIPRDTKVWSRENAEISMAGNDLISEDGREIYSALRWHGVDTLLFAGVHANMCILTRSFGIRQMIRWGVNCVLIRDLTDAMYNPARPPYVSHSRGTELVIEHIEKYWAPTVTSVDLAGALNRCVESIRSCSLHNLV